MHIRLAFGQACPTARTSPGLPVVEDVALVCIVTAHDFPAAAARLFEERLCEETPGGAAAV